MKLLLLLIALFTTTTYAQKVGNIPVTEIDATYIEVYLSSTTLSTKKQVYIDYGQKTKYSFNNKQRLLNNDDDTPMIFYSHIGALNYMDKLGYELIKTYQIKTEDITLQYFILRKKSSSSNGNTSTQNTLEEDEDL